MKSILTSKDTEADRLWPMPSGANHVLLFQLRPIPCRHTHWPTRGYGNSIELRIYVYDKSEMDGLRELMRGMDDQITAQPCTREQWGIQVPSFHLAIDDHSIHGLVSNLRSGIII